jgi:hypothetical protein
VFARNNGKKFLYLTLATCFLLFAFLAIDTPNTIGQEEPGQKVTMTSSCNFSKNVDRSGSDIRSGFDIQYPFECREACLQEENCQSFTFVKAGIQAEQPQCWLKDSKPKPLDKDCCISGVITE